ncbi:MAG: MBL fold metallo-hydrolase [Pseudohongiellaceae bacterium]
MKEGLSRFSLPRIIHHGAASGVTGSCHRLEAFEDCHLLVDCGLFQGESARGDTLEQHRIDFDLSAVKALVVTHVHIDHVGRLPYLLAAGFRGPILCSVPSARLLPLVIEDALKVGFTRDRALIERFLETVSEQLVPLEYKTWHPVYEAGGRLVRVRLQRAGHILGSAYVEVDTRDKDSGYRDRSVFSGDLGAPYAPLLPAPKPPQRADTVVIESTYGGRRHEDRRTRRRRLREVLARSLQRGGTVLIPAFSIGRTQELLYELEGIIHDAASRGSRSGNARNNGDSPAFDWSRLQIIVDSPLAARFTEVYRELKPYWDAEANRRLRAGRHPLDFDALYTVDDHETHERTVEYLAAHPQPAVVLAASGMVAGGRIVNYMKAMLGGDRNSVLFVGYQAPGTPGQALQQLAGREGQGVAVQLDGERVPVHARIHTIGGYSAHADSGDLVNFIRRMRRWPGRIRLVHGDYSAQRGLQRRLLELAPPDTRVELAAEATSTETAD